MDRITGWDKDHAYCIKCFAPNDGAGCDHMDSDKCNFCDAVVEAYDRLAAYEDTWFTPEQCADLVKAGDHWHRRAEALKELLRTVASCDTCVYADRDALQSPCCACVNQSGAWELDETLLALRGDDVE